MGYHVTILRSKNGLQQPIPRGDAEAAIAARPELVAKSNPDGTLDVTVVAKRDESPLLRWQDGEIWTKNPDDETLRLMLGLAQSLRARVRGDEGETYRSVDETYQHPDDATDAELGRRMVAKARRRQWIVNLAPFLVAGAGLLIATCVKRFGS